MRRLVQLMAILVLLLTVAVKGMAQATTPEGRQRSLVGIEVHFPFDKARLDLDYMDNHKAFDRFARTLDSIGIYRVDSVVIVSQSSPEGVYEHNLKLSRRRAATMRRAIEQRHPELDGRLYVHADGESWDRLREYVKNDRRMRQKTIDQVLRIIDSDVNIGTKKWRLEQLPIYRYLRMTYFPRIRNSVFCIVYYEPSAPMAPLPTAVESQLPNSITAIAPVYFREMTEPLLGIRTNLLYDLGTVVNVGLEYYPRNPRWSVVGHYTFPWWSNEKNHHYLQLLDWNLEARYYLQRGKRHAGWYVAPYVHWNLYDISLDAENGWQGEGKGCGLSLGHVFRLGDSERWKLECFVRLGYYHTLFDPYHASDPYNGKYYYDWPYMPEDFIPRNQRLQMIGPTGAGVTLSYDLFRRKLKIDK